MNADTLETIKGRELGLPISIPKLRAQRKFVFHVEALDYSVFLVFNIFSLQLMQAKNLSSALKLHSIFMYFANICLWLKLNTCLLKQYV